MCNPSGMEISRFGVQDVFLLSFPFPVEMWPLISLFIDPLDYLFMLLLDYLWKEQWQIFCQTASNCLYPLQNGHWCPASYQEVWVSKICSEYRWFLFIKTMQNTFLLINFSQSKLISIYIGTISAVPCNNPLKSGKRARTVTKTVLSKFSCQFSWCIATIIMRWVIRNDNVRFIDIFYG